MVEHEFPVGSHVHWGKGKVVWKVLAHVGNGRVPAYDLIALTGGRKDERRQGVYGRKLNAI